MNGREGNELDRGDSGGYPRFRTVGGYEVDSMWGGLYTEIADEVRYWMPAPHSIGYPTNYDTGYQTNDDTGNGIPDFG